MWEIWENDMKKISGNGVTWNCHANNATRWTEFCSLLPTPEGANLIALQNACVYCRTRLQVFFSPPWTRYKRPLARRNRHLDSQGLEFIWVSHGFFFVTCFLQDSSASWRTKSLNTYVPWTRCCLPPPIWQFVFQTTQNHNYRWKREKTREYHGCHRTTRGCDVDDLIVGFNAVFRHPLRMKKAARPCPIAAEVPSPKKIKRMTQRKCEFETT